MTDRGEPRCPGPAAGPLGHDGARAREQRTAMWKATIRGLLARRVRLVVTALAMLLGVSFISATYVLTDTVKQSFDAVFSQTVSGVDLVVEGPRALGDAVEPGRIPESTLDEVRAVPGVAAGGGLRPRARAVRRARRRQHRRRRAADVRRLVGERRPAPPRRRGVSRRPRPRRGAHGRGHRGEERLRGRRPRSDLLLRGPAQQFRIVGLFGFGDTHRLRERHVRRVRPRRPRNASSRPTASLDRVYVQRDPGVQ